MEKRKPRVLFPFTEAGMGHIMPLRSIADTFEKKYGDKVEVVRSQFFTETGNPKLKAVEEKMCEFVKDQNKSGFVGKFSTFAMAFFGTKLDTWACLRVLVPGSKELGVKHMDELDPDIVITTHWATNYYAKSSTKDIKTVVYCPDAHINPLFAYESDLTLISMVDGYEQALKKQKKRFNKDNLKLVPFCIRPEAFDVPTDKQQNRRDLGLDENKFTIVVADGGYGIGSMKAVCEEIIKRDLPITLIPVCGKNEKLHSHFLSLPVGPNISFKPLGFTDQMLRYIASADLFCGKSGNIIAEPTFFGVPSIITKHATEIERIIANNYVKRAKCAINIFKPKKIVNKIEEFLNDRTELDKMSQNALAIHNHYGAEKSVDLIFDMLCEKYPELRV